MDSLLPIDALRQQWRLLFHHAQPLRVLLALASLMAGARLAGHQEAVIPLFLGTIASALAETDDSWRGRLRALLVTLGCFSAVGAVVQALFGLSWVFIAVFCLVAFGLTLLGAIGARYKAIAYGTLILAMYATISAEHAVAAHGPGRHWHEPVLLVAGAAWYGLISVLWCAVFPSQPVQARLVRLFRELGEYVRYKASLFEPLRGVDVERKRLALAGLNARVVAALNEAKEAIFSRLGPRAPTGRLARYRGLYLIAQDVHERASSSHEDYNALADAFFHSDLLYRCRRVLWLQGEACTRLAHSVERREPFVMDGQSVQALAELRSAIAHARATADAAGLARLPAIEALARNLALLDGQLAGASHTAHPSARLGRTDMSLFDRSARDWRDALARVRRQLTVRSPLFRHAVRLSVALAAGYGVMHAVQLPEGYWIMLTTIFVCQPGYGETIARMGQRVAGTALGVVAGWALIELFPQPLLQSVFAVVAGVVFFANRSTRYLLATAAMTLLVLMCFNQITDSARLIQPRLIDTAIGSLIAGLAVLLVLPHWQARRLHEIAAQAMRHHAAYLRQIASQYDSGARDDLAYRLARRNAHNSDAALATAVTEMFREPGFARRRAGVAVRFVIQSHTLLSYLSALGAHRAALPDGARVALLREAAAQAATALEQLAAAVEAGTPGQGADAPARRQLAAWAGDAAAHEADETEARLRLMRTELLLVWVQIDVLQQHAVDWLAVAEPASGGTAERSDGTTSPDGAVGTTARQGPVLAADAQSGRAGLPGKPN
ncbi:YccS family putative transporter [uncultured Pseudacidovorax sp.]|uniref:YccS family putative transporter n=1 Tax=uncultured Pseudacidovorax sp. TaxID=679313 RepID=UPI0025CDB1AD|nr:YccS family putative transporter [uncultured Pseudacidovorax sp.]